MFIWEILLIISLAGMIVILVRRLPQAVAQVREEMPLPEIQQEAKPKKVTEKPIFSPSPVVINDQVNQLSQVVPIPQIEEKKEMASVESADTAYKSGDFTRAVLLYEQLIQSHEDDLKIRNRLGLTYLELERFHEARDLFRQAVKQGSDVASHHANLAMAEYGLGHHVTAIRLLKRAIALSPETKKYQNLLATIEEERG